MPERVLVLVGSEHLGKDELSFLGRCASRGARVVAWQHPIVGQDRFPSPDIARYLQALGIEATPLPVALGEPVNTEVEEAVIAWMKRLRNVSTTLRHPRAAFSEPRLASGDS